MWYFFDITDNPFIWSKCSWVTNIPSKSEIFTSKESKASEIFLQLVPQSTKILALSDSTKEELPELPLYKLQNLNIQLSNFNNEKIKLYLF